MVRSVIRFLQGRLWLVLLADVIVAGLFVYYIPTMKRPLEHLMLVLAGLGIVTAVAAGRGLLRNLCAAVISCTLMVFLLEMAQKKFDIVNFSPTEAPGVRVSAGLGAGSDYVWNPTEPLDYLAVKARAIADGVYKPALQDQFAGDIFAGTDRSKLYEIRSERRRKTSLIWSLRPFIIEDESPMGYELTPDNRIRECAMETSTGEMLFDGEINTTPAGYRVTKGNPDGDVYVFTGCSVTFGFGLSDHLTMPYFFNEASGFDKNVVNLAMNGYGSHNILRDFELDHHMGRAGIDPARVKGVYYQFFDEHAIRAVNSRRKSSPRYVLENGRAVYKGTYNDLGRFFLMMERSRIYPQVRERLINTYNLADKMDLTLAMLGQLHDICRERYGVPLTLIYRGNSAEVLDFAKEKGIIILNLNEALEKDWQQKAIEYLLYDTHPGVLLNRQLGRSMHQYVTTGTWGPVPREDDTNTFNDK